MNGVGMIILSGIRIKTKFTCFKESKGKMRKSVVDHICIQEGVMESIVEEETRQDVMECISTDHAMVSMTIRLKVIKNKEAKEDSVHRNNKSNRKPKPLNRITNEKVWQEYKNECRNNEQLKNIAEKLTRANTLDESIKKIEENWVEFKKTISTLEEWVRNIEKKLGEKQYTYLNQMIRINEEIAQSRISKKTAWKRYLKSKGTDEEQRKCKHFRWARNRAKKLIKRRLEAHNKAVIKEIENLKIESPKLFWKKLKELNGNKKKEAYGIRH